jgi:hypothetical protein
LWIDEKACQLEALIPAEVALSANFFVSGDALPHGNIEIPLQHLTDYKAAP